MQASYVEIRNVLKNLHFPLTKQELIQQAIKHGASHQIVGDLKNIPDREYTSSNDIVKEFCGLRLR
ncbi:MAG: DUF2795 domain-containing protein [Alphaproteobacteria bacterium]|nr:MAG: DUF2795 domain-containing protein [Alphaproteobacteria bacterium]